MTDQETLKATHDLVLKTYEIAVGNQAKMVYTCERLQKLEALHESCPGRQHALRSEGAGAMFTRIATAVGMIGTLIMATLALLKSGKAG